MFIKITEYKSIYKANWFVFLYTINKQFKNGIKNTIPFTVSCKNKLNRNKFNKRSMRSVYLTKHFSEKLKF